MFFSIVSLLTSDADFEITFAPELAFFAPLQPRNSTPTPTWAVGPPLVESSMLQSLPHSQTNGTIQTTDTSILDTPSRTTRQERSRLSFLQRNKHELPPLPSGVNGHNRTRTDDTTSTRSASKETRRSLFGNGIRTGSVSESGDGDWVTDSGYEATPEKLKTVTRKRSESGGHRPDPNAVGRVNSVRKRLSLLKLGKKASKVSVLVDSVVEE